MTASIQRTALAEFTPNQLFDLVDDVRHYPDFLPWCSAVDVLDQSEQQTSARLHVNFRGIRQHFATRNRKARPGSMTLELLEGPFSDLRGEWRFIPLGDAACRVEFTLNYRFSSRILEKLLGPVFGHIAGTMVDAFLHEAGRRYGQAA